MNTERVERICANCELSQPIGDSDACICSKRGIVRARGVCSEFCEDLLKVIPSPPAVLGDKDNEICNI